MRHTLKSDSDAVQDTSGGSPRRACYWEMVTPPPPSPLTGRVGCGTRAIPESPSCRRSWSARDVVNDVNARPWAVVPTSTVA